jgi:hypothetical protein
MFYVYIKFRPDGRPCYVGKGRGIRYRVNHRPHNRHLQAITKAAGGKLMTKIVRRGLTEVAAFALERSLIAGIKREVNGGPLVNQTDGGDGISGHRHSAEDRRVMGDLVRARWSNPVWKERAIVAQNAGKSTPEFSAKRSALSKRTWGDLDRRQRASQKKKQMYVDDPSLRERVSAATKVAMARPDVLDRHSVAQKIRARSEAGRRHLMDISRKGAATKPRLGVAVSDETRAKMSASAKLRCQNPEWRAALLENGKRGAAMRKKTGGQSWQTPA